MGCVPGDAVLALAQSDDGSIQVSRHERPPAAEGHARWSCAAVHTHALAPQEPVTATRLVTAAGAGVVLWGCAQGSTWHMQALDVHALESNTSSMVRILSCDLYAFCVPIVFVSFHSSRTDNFWRIQTHRV